MAYGTADSTTYLAPSRTGVVPKMLHWSLKLFKLIEYFSNSTGRRETIGT